ncbi:unnamed protein product [Eruca vesicaria subsp. sativa]|uniref:RING-type domain-containing protein n=1 Tax=Eruca vesicaria subsp. sativa TaxID=29727 RepID=A0ABC8J590_ERUVS|nr:unnamed protein product [Eruca vesicaria subsp. sativa]
MGSVCCVAVKERKVPPSPPFSSGLAPLACSPQWSFRRDNRRRVADEIEGSPYYSLESRSISLRKTSLGSERGTLSEGGGGGGTLPLDGSLGTLASQKPATSSDSSFDSEHLGSSRRKLSNSSSRFSLSPSVVVDQQTCGVCSKLLTERSSFVATFELSIAAFLACGHVYHAECLETMTTEIDKYDPTCPICTIGEKRVAKVTKAEKYKGFKNHVVDNL